MLSALGKHDESFGRPVEQTKVVTAANGRLDTEGNALSTATSRLVKAAAASDDPDARDTASEVERVLLVVWINNWRFQALYDPKRPTAFGKSIDRAKAALGSLKSSDLKDLRTTAEAATDAYADSFVAISTATLASIDIDEKTLVPQIVAMQSRLGSAKTSLEAEFATSGRQTLDVSQRTVWLQQLVAALLLLVGIAPARVIGRGVARPIASMTTAMTQLAGGDKTITVPGRDRTDEIGGMARAVEVLLRQAMENDDLAADQARQQAAKERRQLAMDRNTQDFGQPISGMMVNFMAAADKMRIAAR